jgi:hypothetical protein
VIIQDRLVTRIERPPRSALLDAPIVRLGGGRRVGKNVPEAIERGAKPFSLSE